MCVCIYEYPKFSITCHSIKIRYFNKQNNFIKKPIIHIYTFNTCIHRQFDRYKIDDLNDPNFIRDEI